MLLDGDWRYEDRRDSFGVWGHREVHCLHRGGRPSIQQGEAHRLSGRGVTFRRADGRGWSVFDGLGPSGFVEAHRGEDVQGS